MKRIAMVSRVGAGAAALAILACVGSAPAGAATPDTLYTATSQQESEEALGTIDLLGPTFAPLGPNLPVPYSTRGIDLFGEIGYGIAYNDDDTEFYVYTWDHNTGAISTPVVITQAIDDTINISFVVAADTLADGTLIAFLGLSNGGPESDYVVSIDPVTGVATELVDVTGAADFFDGLATDPTTGITYAFVDEDDGVPQYLVLDLVGGTYTGPTDLTGIQDSFGDGYVVEADFTPTGSLFFYYRVFGPPEDYTLLGATSGGPFGATVGADFVGGGDVADGISLSNLTLGPAVVKPALANTGLPLAGLLVGGVALVGAGLAAVYVTRRRSAT